MPMFSLARRLSWCVSQFQVIAQPGDGPVRSLEPDIGRLWRLRGPQIVPYTWYQLRLGPCPIGREPALGRTTRTPALERRYPMVLVEPLSTGYPPFPWEVRLLR